VSAARPLDRERSELEQSEPRDERAELLAELDKADRAARRAVDGRTNGGNMTAAGRSRSRRLLEAALPAVAEKRRRNNGRPTVEQIVAALKQYDTQAEAAAALGIDERTIRNNVPEETRQAIRASKKPES
jgi:hypothetical protein